MRKLIIGTAIAAFLAGSVAFAAEIRATITYIDIDARIIVIDNRAFHVPTTIDIKVFKVGEKVTIIYERNNGQLRIVSIKVN